MNCPRIPALILTLALLGSSAWAAAPAAPASGAVAPGPAASAARARRTVAPPPAVLVDINSADRETLKTLPGIGDAEAAKIIAGRPYLTKAHLVTHKVLSMEVYQGLKAAVIARQKGTVGPGKSVRVPAAAASAKKGQP